MRPGVRTDASATERPKQVRPERGVEHRVHVIEVAVDVRATDHRKAAAAVAEEPREVQQPNATAGQRSGLGRCVSGESPASGDRAHTDRAPTPTPDRANAICGRVAHSRNVADDVDPAHRRRHSSPDREVAADGQAAAGRARSHDRLHGGVSPEPGQRLETVPTAPRRNRRRSRVDLAGEGTTRGCEGRGAPAGGLRGYVQRSSPVRRVTVADQGHRRLASDHQVTERARRDDRVVRPCHAPTRLIWSYLGGAGAWDHRAAKIRIDARSVSRSCSCAETPRAAERADSRCVRTGIRDPILTGHVATRTSPSGRSRPSKASERQPERSRIEPRRERTLVAALHHGPDDACRAEHAIRRAAVTQGRAATIATADAHPPEHFPPAQRHTDAVRFDRIGGPLTLRPDCEPELRATLPEADATDVQRARPRILRIQSRRKREQLLGHDGAERRL